MVAIHAIERRIHLIREQKLMLDRDFAEMYGVPTMALKQHVKRNANRFPPDFMFRLSKGGIVDIAKCDINAPQFQPHFAKRFQPSKAWPCSPLC